MSDYLTYLEISAFVASLIALPVLKRRPYLLLFPLLLLPVVLVEGYQAFINPDKGSTTEFIYNFQVPLVQLLYLIMLAWSMESLRKRKWILIATLVFLGFSIITILYYLGEAKFNVLSYSLGCIFLTAGILIKFYEMLKSPTKFDFLKDPFFYMLFAFLLFNMGTLPYFSMANWLYYSIGNHDLVIILYNAMMILNLLLYFTYTICFLWMRAMKDSY
ncbi:MAG: hypothetical protein AAF693_06520 [Bacteroidota bacterium]